VLRPHDRKDAKLGVAGLAPEKLDYSVVFFIGESVASNEFGSDGRFAHTVVLARRRGEKVSDMLPDRPRLYQVALSRGCMSDYNLVNEN
jgi:hypothetical protein